MNLPKAYQLRNEERAAVLQPPQVECVEVLAILKMNPVFPDALLGQICSNGYKMYWVFKGLGQRAIRSTPGMDECTKGQQGLHPTTTSRDPPKE